jgi:hypothetical protein
MFQANFVEKIKTHFVFSKLFFGNRAFYEIMWKNTVESGRPKMTMWLMRIACWMSKATTKHTEYVILTAFTYNAKIVARKRLNVALCIHSLSCYKINTKVLFRFLIKNRKYLYIRMSLIWKHSLCFCARLSFATNVYKLLILYVLFIW